MAIAYSAYTEGATFLLDEVGVCRRVLLKPDAKANGGKRDSNSDNPANGVARTRVHAARMIVGAQYVASIDRSVEGGLVPMPRTGASMLFAYADESGRLAVVRTGPLVRFETLAEPRETIVSLPDYEDDCVTIPLPSPIAPPTTERRPSAWLVPTAPISEADDTIREDITLDGGILEDDKSATVPHLAADLPPTWPKLPMDREATVRPISILDADDAPTRSRRSVPDKRPAAPTPRGMLPKRATRG